MGFLTGKRVLIVGVASKLSIASGIAAAMHREGAELAFTYQNEKLKGRVEEFAASWGSGPFDAYFVKPVLHEELLEFLRIRMAEARGA